MQAGFFMTYCFTSGWAGLACEIIQPVGLIWNLIARVIVKNQDASYETLRFPYHIEIPRLLLFGLLGFTNSVIAPLILPFLLIYFFLAYLIYKNQVHLQICSLCTWTRDSNVLIYFCRYSTSILQSMKAGDNTGLSSTTLRSFH